MRNDVAQSRTVVTASKSYHKTGTAKDNKALSELHNLMVTLPAVIFNTGHAFTERGLQQDVEGDTVTFSNMFYFNDAKAAAVIEKFVTALLDKFDLMLADVEDVVANAKAK